MELSISSEGFIEAPESGKGVDKIGGALIKNDGDHSWGGWFGYL